MLMLLSSADAVWDSYPSGWTPILDNYMWGGSQGHMSVLKRISDGTETSTVTAGTVGTERTAHAVWVVDGNGVDFTVSTPDIGTPTKVADTSTINLPAVTVSHGAADYLVFPLIGRNGGAGAVVDTLPAGYTTMLEAGSGVGSVEAGLWVGQQRVAVTSVEDPGSLTYVGSWSARRIGAVTVAVLAETSAGVAAGDHAHTEDDVSDITTLSQKATPVDADRVKIYDSEDSDTYKWSELGDLPGGGGGGGDLTDLDDVTITGTPADNEVVAYDTSTSEFINQTAAEAGLAAASHTHTESDVTDLDHWTETDHDALDHTGLTGVGGAAELDDLTDVDLSTPPSDNQILRFDDGSSTWLPEDLPAAGAFDLDDADDVVITSVQDGDVVTWDSGTSKWVNEAPSGGGGGAVPAWITHLAERDDTADADDDEFDDGSLSGSWTTVTPTGTATLTEARGVLSGVVVNQAGGDCAAIVKPIRAGLLDTTVTVEIAVRFLHSSVQGLFLGPVFSVGSDVTDAVIWQMTFFSGGGTFDMRSGTFTNVSTDHNQPGNAAGYSITPFMYQRFEFHSTSGFKQFWSPGGNRFSSFGGGYQANPLGGNPTHYGIGFSSFGASVEKLFDIEYFRVIS
jgi:hypothetical protein